MRKRRKKREVADGIKVRGFFRMQLVNKETGEIEGDSGWCPNTVTNFGLNNACAGTIIGESNSVQALSAVLATQSTAVDATQISLVGTENAVVDLTPSTVATGTARVTASFDGTDNSATLTIGSVGLHSNSQASNSMIAGQTYTTSQFATNQDLNMTYELQFS